MNIRTLNAYHSMMHTQRKRLHELPKRKKVRCFRLPKINFEAKNYWEMVPIGYRKVVGPYTPPKEPFFPVHTLNYKGTQQYDPITEPPLTAHLTTVEINALKNIPLKSKFECHTQSVERGVALTADSVKRRRTADTQLMCALSTAAAREACTGKITHKHYEVPKFE